jgi:hypothetical protein
MEAKKKGRYSHEINIHTNTKMRRKGRHEERETKEAGRNE